MKAEFVAIGAHLVNLNHVYDVFVEYGSSGMEAKEASVMIVNQHMHCLNFSGTEYPAAKRFYDWYKVNSKNFNTMGVGE